MTQVTAAPGNGVIPVRRPRPAWSRRPTWPRPTPSPPSWATPPRWAVRRVRWKRWSSGSPACWWSSTRPRPGRVRSRGQLARRRGHRRPARRSRSAARGRPGPRAPRGLRRCRPRRRGRRAVGHHRRPGRRARGVGRPRGGLRRIRPGLPLPDRPAPRARHAPPAPHAPHVGAARVGGRGRGLRLGLPAGHPRRVEPARPDRRVLFDPRRATPLPGGPGDRVRFTVAHAEPPHRRGVRSARPAAARGRRRSAASRCSSRGWPPPSRTAGRRGVAHLGVPAAGAVDPRAAAGPPPAGRRSVRHRGPGVHGRRPDAPGGRRRPPGRGRRRAGCGRGRRRRPAGTRRGRASRSPTDRWSRVGRIAAACGPTSAWPAAWSHPVLFGSRSSDVLAGLGPGPLRTGDRLARGAPGRVRGHLEPGRRPTGGPVVLRVRRRAATAAPRSAVATTWVVGAATSTASGYGSPPAPDRAWHRGRPGPSTPR